MTNPSPTSPITAERIVALLPMAGRATRLGAQQHSKEVLPVRASPNARPQPLGSFLLDHLARAGIRTAHIITRPEKTDIARTFGTGPAFAMRLHYDYLDHSDNTPQTLAQALGSNNSKNSNNTNSPLLCALGFPDILFRPCDAYAKLLRHLNQHPQCDIVLGLFPTNHPHQVDLVATTAAGVVSELVIKTTQPTPLRHTWSVALWRPVFSQFLCEWVAQAHQPLDREAYVGDVIQAAMGAGLRADAIIVSTGYSLDAGTPATLAQAQRGDW